MTLHASSRCGLAWPLTGLVSHLPGSEQSSSHLATCALEDLLVLGGLLHTGADELYASL